MLSSHSLPAIIQNASICQRAVFTCIWCPSFKSGAPIFVTAVQGMPLDYLTLVARGASVLRPSEIITSRDIIFGRLPPPGHCTDSKLKHTPSLSVKKDYLLVLQP